MLLASQPLSRTAGGITSGFTGWSGLIVDRADGRSALVAPKVFWELPDAMRCMLLNDDRVLLERPSEFCGSRADADASLVVLTN